MSKCDWTMSEAQAWVSEHKEDNGKSMKKLDRVTREKIQSRVRYKSYGRVKVKNLEAADEEPMLLVRGFFTDSEMDEVGDIITQEGTEKAVEKWRRWGNIRTMHDYPSGRVEAIGTKDGLSWNEIVTVPVDEQTIKLIEGGVLQAYSVGIIPTKYELNEEAMEESDDPWFWPLIIHEYDLIEISYVDHPANYSATFEDISTGKTRGRSAVLFRRMPDEWSEDMDKDVDGMTDESLDAEEVESILAEAEEETAAALEAFEAAPEDFKEADDEASDDNEDESDESEFTPEEDAVVMAVRGIVEEQVGALKEFVTEELPNIVAEVVTERLKESLTPEISESSDGELEGEEKSIATLFQEFIEAKDSFVKEVKLMLDEAREELAKDIEEALSAPIRRARITVDGEPGEKKTAEEITRELLAEPYEDRLNRMREILKRG